jgi:hypothetical protein
MNFFLRSSGFVCLTGFLAVNAVHAQRLNPLSVPGKEYALVHKSSFTGTETDRNPFWPVGWKPAPAGPAAPDAPVVEAPPEVSADNFVVTTISLEKEGALAVINGRTYAVGDRLPVDSRGKEFVTVRQIIDGAVIFDYHGRQIRSVAGRRPPKK